MAVNNIHNDDTKQLQPNMKNFLNEEGKTEWKMKMYLLNNEKNGDGAMNIWQREIFDVFCTLKGEWKITSSNGFHFGKY